MTRAPRRLALCLATALTALSVAAVAAPVDPATFSAMRWRLVGPFRGGRALAVAGVPDQPGVYYFGASAGGVWKTEDAGARWKPIFDTQKIASIGAIAVAPSNHDVIYVGSGEGALRGDITYGDGVYKSTDAGKTWTHVGLSDTRQIGALIVHPKNPDVALVAAIGHAFGPNAERGVFRTEDGGKTWQKVLYRDENTGAIDVTFDPTNPDIVYAALWQVRRQPWNFSSGGPGSGLFRSTDGGKTWTELKGNGLPDGILGKIDVAVSAADPKRVYAMIEAKAGGLYRSDDGGAHWRLVTDDGRLRQRAWYFSKIYADPKNVDVVYALNTGMLRSKDGGAHFDLVPATHGDHHGLWIDPTDPRKLVNANDGGASVSLDGGATWSTQYNQPTASLYHVNVDNRFPYWVYAAQQDNSNLAIASFDDEGVIGPGAWYPAGGGETGVVIPDPRDALNIYSNNENTVVRYNKHREQVQDISPFPIDNSGHGAADLPHRFNWTSPMFISPHDPDALYVGSEVVWKTTNHGMSWKIISPDLTRNDKSKQQPSGGPLTKDITSVEYYDTIFALAESPVRKGAIWAGTDDGLVHVTLDDGARWNTVTPPDMPAWSTIDLIEASRFDAGTAYLAVDRHKLDDIAPYAWKTSDFGKTWTPIAHGLPDGAVVHAIREDSVKRGLLYAATERGVFVSFNDGGEWQPLQMNLPVAPVHDLRVKGDDLVAGTHGRAIWILDDLTPLRQAAEAGEDIVLYAPEKALRLHYPDEVDTRRAVGTNPPAGALIDYYFKTKPAGEVSVDIVDAKGAVIRHLSSTKTQKEEQPAEWPDRIVPQDKIPAEAGMNRLVWDLRMNDPAQIPGAFYSGVTPRGPLALPGEYTVRLTANGKTLSQKLVLSADPRVPNAEPAIRAKTALAVAAVKDIDALHKAVNSIRGTRAALQKALPGLAGPQAQQAQAVLAGLDPIEQRLIQVNMKGSEANLAFPGMLNERYATFADTLADADMPPTAQHQAAFNALHVELEVQLLALRQLRDGELKALNAGLKAAGKTAIE